MIRPSGWTGGLPVALSALWLLGWPGVEVASGAVKKDSEFLWLEEIEGKEALRWVDRENRRSLKILRARPEYGPFKQQALAILQARDKIPTGQIQAGYVYNFWQDEAHVQGIWRRTPWEKYRAGTAEWETLLDVDALSKQAGITVVFQGANCLRPLYERCLLRLSEGGSDASRVREFDVATRSFVPGGFELEPSKSSLEWLDADQVLLADALQQDSRTISGYPRRVLIWKRGTPPGAAASLYQVERQDVSARAAVIHDGETRHVLLFRAKGFFTQEVSYLQDGRPVKLPIPQDAIFQDLFQDHALIINRQPVAGFEAGSLLALPLRKLLSGKAEYMRVLAPGPTQAIRGASRGLDYVYVSLLEQAQSKLLRLRVERTATGAVWKQEALPLEGMGNLALASVDEDSNRLLISYEDFLTPTVLYALEGKAAERTRAFQLPPRFDAAGLIVRQDMATSPDGTRIPYFLVHRQGLSLTGKNPTLLYGYGGFEVPMVPRYLAVVGKLWLERGGVYALANIRGGGEFGPAWHQAALGKNREKAFEDFTAVARALIERKVTSPGHLGIQGGSNGGLLVGAAFTRNPELFAAVLCEVPLLDMLRYHKLLAGQSWMAEYGDPDDPELAAVLGRYSPFHNVRPKQSYPEVFFVTSTRDDRVHPGHARRMAARLAEQKHPFLYYENTEGGHSASANLLQQAERNALEYSYLWMKLRLKKSPK